MKQGTVSKPSLGTVGSVPELSKPNGCQEQMKEKKNLHQSMRRDNHGGTSFKKPSNSQNHGAAQNSIHSNDRNDSRHNPNKLNGGMIDGQPNAQKSSQKGSNTRDPGPNEGALPRANFNNTTGSTSQHAHRHGVDDRLKSNRPQDVRLETNPNLERKIFNMATYQPPILVQRGSDQATSNRNEELHGHKIAQKVNENKVTKELTAGHMNGNQDQTNIEQDAKQDIANEIKVEIEEPQPEFDIDHKRDYVVNVQLYCKGELDTAIIYEVNNETLTRHSPWFKRNIGDEKDIGFQVSEDPTLVCLMLQYMHLGKFDALCTEIPDTKEKAQVVQARKGQFEKSYTDADQKQSIDSRYYQRLSYGELLASRLYRLMSMAIKYEMPGFARAIAEKARYNQAYLRYKIDVCKAALGMITNAIGSFEQTIITVNVLMQNDDFRNFKEPPKYRAKTTLEENLQSDNLAVPDDISGTQSTNGERKGVELKTGTTSSSTITDQLEVKSSIAETETMVSSQGFPIQIGPTIPEHDINEASDEKQVQVRPQEDPPEDKVISAACLTPKLEAESMNTGPVGTELDGWKLKADYPAINESGTSDGESHGDATSLASTITTNAREVFQDLDDKNFDDKYGVCSNLQRENMGDDVDQAGLSAQA